MKNNETTYWIFTDKLKIGISMIIPLFIFTGCNDKIPTFSGEKAFEYLEAQCEYGPRNPGSEGYNNCRDYLFNKLNVLADSVFFQSFNLTELRDGKSYKLSNIVSEFNVGSDKTILLGAHWDTRPWADRDPDINRRNEPILGANDGASGVAVLLHMAELFNKYKLPVNIVIVLFDGEDLGVEGVPESYARGSYYFADNLPVKKPNEAIIIDMIGDRNLNISIERNSYHQNQSLVKTLWNLAEKLELPAFDRTIKNTIYDDHVPLWQIAKIPAVDLIDFEYPGRFTNYWHTHRDLPSNCSAESLEQVGILLTNYIYGMK